MSLISDNNLQTEDILTFDFSESKIVIVKTIWNSDIVDELENGCRKKCNQFGLTRIETITAPGAFEIPYIIQKTYQAHNPKPVAFVALACVIRGDTPHFDYVCKAITDGVLHLNLTLPVPSIFGVLTVENKQQALDRIGGKHGHKGEEAALTCLNMVRFAAKNFEC